MQLMTVNNTTITSLELREIINQAREASGQNEVRNNKLLERIESELEGELDACKIISMPNRVEMRYYDLTMAQAVQILARESGAARRLVAALIEDHQKLLSAYKEIDVDELEQDRFVYVIKNTLTGAYKVGISKDPDARLKQLQTGSDGELVLIGCKRGTYSDESEAHRLHAGKRIRSEWFNLQDQEVKALIN